MIFAHSRFHGLLCVFAVLLSFAVTAAAKEPAAYQIDTSRTRHAMNWFAGQLEVVGKGFALDKGDMVQARATAYTILINEARAALATLQVDSATRLGTAVKDAEAKSIANEMVARIKIVSEQWDEQARAYTIVGVMPLYGQHNLTYLGAKALTSFTPIDFKEDMITITMPIPHGYTPQKFEGPYTGIIVDGDQALLTPCLFPRIARMDGKELWGPFSLSPAEAIAGPARYAPNLDAALRRQLAGDRPLILTAIGNGLSYNPVINLDDVYLVMLHQKKTQIFNALPVVITLGQKELPEEIK